MKFTASRWRKARTMSIRQDGALVHGFLRRFLLPALVLLVPCLRGAERPNVLFIAVDDLRPQLGCYGVPHVKSPHIDRFASRGLLFKRAYCMVPTCGASRASLMTGIRPSPNRFVTFYASAEKETPAAVTLNTHFTRNGYRTISNGKIFHNLEDSAAGWSEPPWRPKSFRDRKMPPKPGEKGLGPPFAVAQGDDDSLYDGQTALKAVADLKRLKDAGSPFLLAVGFYKPHLPFVCPKKYWDLYPPDLFKAPDLHVPTEGVLFSALHPSYELRTYEGVPLGGPMPDETALGLIRGYHACVSYVDAQIGRVLTELERLGLDGNTIVVLWGDHGWNLGEHGLWCKHSCFETSMRAPLIIRVPGRKGGVVTEALIEFIDIYPTLCELAGLPVPAQVEGRSFVPLLDDPARPWKDRAVGRYEHGDTIRTDRHRYTEYARSGSRPSSRMLYDHHADPAEHANLAQVPVMTETVGALSRMLAETKGKDLPAPAPPDEK
jgi:iduronate 2-sulfatase